MQPITSIKQTPVTEGGHGMTTTAEPEPRLESGQLFAGGRRLVIEHSGMEYILRITRQGKLILTK